MRFPQALERLAKVAQERPYNLLVLSDLHLGQDLKAAPRKEDPRGGRMDRALAAFLSHHATHRAGGKPWRLLLNGDIVDFVAITLTPVPGSDTPFEVTQAERRDGLAPEEPKCVWKLQRVAERHALVFDALAHFLRAGNEIHVVRGNHDAEFHFPAVQAEWRRLLVERCGVGGAARRRLERALRFHAWFYLEPGFLYVEHGNAHDRFCLQSGFFDAAPANRHEQAALAGELELPMSSKVLRFFVNRYAAGQEDLEEADSWDALQYLAWVFRAGNPLQIAADYFVMVARVLLPVARESLGWTRRAARLAGRTLRRLGDDHARVACAQRALSRFADDSGRAARQLALLAQRPAEASLFDAAQLFYVDRMLLSAAALGATGLAFLLLPVLWMKLLAFGAVGVGFALGNALLGRLRRADAHPLLRTAARRVAQIFDARYVVMGHSHRAVDEPAGPHARYFNLGSWTVVRDEGFPHALVVGKQAVLARWRGPAEALAQVAALEAGPHARHEAQGVPVPVALART